MARNNALSVADLERMLEDRRAELSQLTDRRERLATELAKCDERISELQGERAKGSRTKVAVRKKPARGRRRNKTSLGAVINDILEKTKKPLSVDEIVEKAKASGYKTRSAKFKNVVYQNLFHMRNKGEIGYDADQKLYLPKSA